MKMWKLKNETSYFCVLIIFSIPSSHSYNAVQQIHKKSLFSLSDVWNLSYIFLA